MAAAKVFSFKRNYDMPTGPLQQKLGHSYFSEDQTESMAFLERSLFIRVNSFFSACLEK